MQQKYLVWLEEQSQMKISTIHSFALNIFKLCGIDSGFNGEVGIKSLAYDRKELIKDIVDSKLKKDIPINRQIGMSYYKAVNIIDDFWKKFATLGYTYDEMMDMSWGNPGDEKSAGFHNLFMDVMAELDQEYIQIKKKKNAIGVNDILRDLSNILDGIQGELQSGTRIRILVPLFSEF